MRTSLARADFLSGNGAPSSELGTNGDHYFDVQTAKLYKKSSDSWSLLVTRNSVHVSPLSFLFPNVNQLGFLGR